MQMKQKGVKESICVSLNVAPKISQVSFYFIFRWLIFLLFQLGFIPLMWKYSMKNDPWDHLYPLVRGDNSLPPQHANRSDAMCI